MAFDHYHQAGGSDPKAMVGLAIARFETGDMRGAAQSAREATRLVPDAAEAYYYLSLALEHTPGGSAEAVRALVAAHQLEPTAFPFPIELGVGLVRQIEGRFLTVFFPEVDREVVLSATGAGLTRLMLPQGSRARLLSEEEDVVIAEARGHSYLLADGREVPDADLWPLGRADTPLERLATLELDSVDAFRNRLQGLELMELREAGGLGSFLGGRVQLFPHQLHAAMRAVDADPVRWLLADEVGLGKTVEACLILSALVRTGRAERALVIAPSTLAIQWLGELYRKFHQIFVLLDNERIESVELDYGEGVNPFEVHPLAVIPLELLASDARLLRQAEEAGLELVVLDEAHRLVGEEVTRTLGPLVRGCAPRPAADRDPAAIRSPRLLLAALAAAPGRLRELRGLRCGRGIGGCDAALHHRGAP